MTIEKATYKLLNGETVTVEYDTEAPCLICQEPVMEASVGGTAICPWCDTGACRYCGEKSRLISERLDGGSSIRRWYEHMRRHHSPSAARLIYENPSRSHSLRPYRKL